MKRIYDLAFRPSMRHMYRSCVYAKKNALQENVFTFMLLFKRLFFDLLPHFISTDPLIFFLCVKVRLLVELYLCGVCDDAQLLVRCLRRSYRGTAPPRKDGSGEIRRDFL